MNHESCVLCLDIHSRCCLKFIENASFHSYFSHPLLVQEIIYEYQKTIKCSQNRLQPFHWVGHINLAILILIIIVIVVVVVAVCTFCPTTWL